MERGFELLNESGIFGFIVQNKFLYSGYGEGLRQYITENAAVEEVLDFEDAPIFSGTTTYPLILRLSKDQSKNLDTHILRTLQQNR